MNSAKNGTLDLPLILSATVTVALLAVAGVLFLQAWYRTMERDERAQKRVEVPLADRESYESEQRALLSGYRWLDPENGTLTLPIERAMELVVEEREGR